MTTLTKSVVIALFFVAFSNTQIWGNMTSDSEILSYKLIEKVVIALEKKHQLSGCGFGVNGNEDDIEISLSFNAKSSCSLEDSRKLILQCAHEYLNQINNEIKQSDKGKKCFLELSDVELYIFFPTPPQEKMIGSLSCVSLRKGVVYYRAWKNENCGEFIKEEGFEEAERLVAAESAAGDGDHPQQGR